MIRKSILPILAIAVLAVGCASQKEPATRAVADAEAALAAVRDQAARWAPDQLQSVESALAGLKDSLGKGDYKAVLAAAPKLVTDVSELKSAADAALQSAIERASGEWSTLAADLPNMVSAIESRVNILSKSRRLPAGLDQARFDAAKAGLADMKNSWTRASDAFASGNVLDAVSIANDVKAKGAEIMTTLGMTSG
jgi:hypothetical protein